MLSYYQFKESTNNFDSLIKITTDQIALEIEKFLKKYIPTVQSNDIKDKVTGWSKTGFQSPFSTHSFMKESIEILEAVLDKDLPVANFIDFTPLKTTIHKILTNFANQTNSSIPVATLVEPEQSKEDTILQLKNNPTILDTLKSKESKDLFLSKLRSDLLDKKVNKSLVGVWLNKLLSGKIVPYFQNFLDRYNEPNKSVSPGSSGKMHKEDVPTRPLSSDEEEKINRIIKSKGNIYDLLWKMFESDLPVNPKDIVSKFPELKGKIIHIMPSVTNAEFYKKFRFF